MIVWGNQVNIMERPKILPAHVNPAGVEKWSVEGLHDSLSSHYNSDYVPVWGGYSVPPQ
jgi:3-oxoacyl-[acyl-carrier protein] reductase